MGTQIDLFYKFTRKADKGLKVFLAGSSGQMNWVMVDPTSLRAPTSVGGGASKGEYID
jgi:hypothetical protein